MFNASGYCLVLALNGCSPDRVSVDWGVSLKSGSDPKGPSQVSSTTHGSRIYGTGEMAERTRAFDWSATSIGPIEQWPDTLVITVNTLLASRQPMFLWWGPELIQFYNDAYRPSIRSDKHPRALGQHGRDCWPEIWDVIGPQIDGVMSSGIATWHEDQLIPIFRDGKLEDVYWTYSYSPVRDAEGAIRGTLVVCSETTGRVLAEAARDAVAEQLQQVFDATTDAFVSLDRNWRMTFLNRRAREILAPRGDVLGTRLWDSFPATVYEGSPYVENYYRAMDQGIAGQFEAYYPEPLNIWLHVMAQPTRDGIVVFFRDITEQRRESAALIQAEKLAAVGRLASSIAHEINNPLEAVTNLLYLSATSGNLDEVQKYLAIAQQELARVTNIATQTLRFHRQSTNARETALRDILESVLTLFQGRISNAGITIERDYRTDRKIVAFEGDLRQVFANLISNSLDATARGGRIKLRVFESRNWTTGEASVRVVVADSGCGMSKETRRHIFEPFFTTKSSTGTGLGLWVSAEILRNHNAAVSVRSSQHSRRHGTIFSISFPVTTRSGVKQTPAISESRATGER